MSGFATLLIPIALIGVALILLLGLINMARGKNPNRSQSLMRWRVALQLVAICIILLSLYLYQ
nr:twin transmembrane helix small protein [uncultured Cohaesibacter sp.]